MDDDETLELDGELLRVAQLAWPQELRAASIHEWAHFHVAKYFGIFGWVHIVFNWNRGIDERYFYGNFTMQQLSDNVYANRMIGLAGSCAEALDADTTEENIVGLIVEGAIELSATDAAMAGEFNYIDVEECLAILRSQWPFIQRDAIADNERLADSLADELARLGREAATG